MKSFLLSIFAPFKLIKRRYLPLLLIYFSYGASGFSSIAESFWVKENLELGASELVALGVWLGIPWSIKMVFGQMVDSISIFGSRRKVYVYIGAFLMILGNLLLVALGGEYEIIQAYSKEAIYIVSSVLMVIGFVMQDVVADTMSTEVVDNSATKEEIRKELASIQVLGRLSLFFAIILTSGTGGWLAQHYSYETIFKISLLIPIISIIGINLAKLETPAKSPLSFKIFYGGLVFAIFTIFMGYNNFEYAQEIIFMVSLCVVLYMLFTIIKELDKRTTSAIISMMFIIFTYRAMPGVGPAMAWWQIDILGFDKAFFGTLAQIGSILGFAGLWLSSSYIIKQKITNIFVFLIIFSFVLSLPILGMYYNLHEYLGISARTLALIDDTVASPFDQIAMVVMLSLVAIYAPKGKKGTWFALMASFMNLALSAKGLISKYLNEIFVVTREIKKDGVVIVSADYSKLDELFITVILLNLIIPLVVIFFVSKKLK